MELAQNLIAWTFSISILSFMVGMSIYFTTVYTLRAWHCYKNVKIDPINATKKVDTSAAHAEQLKNKAQNLIDQG